MLIHQSEIQKQIRHCGSRNLKAVLYEDSQFSNPLSISLSLLTFGPFFSPKNPPLHQTPKKNKKNIGCRVTQCAKKAKRHKGRTSVASRPQPTQRDVFFFVCFLPGRDNKRMNWLANLPSHAGKTKNSWYMSNFLLKASWGSEVFLNQTPKYINNEYDNEKSNGSKWSVSSKSVKQSTDVPIASKSCVFLLQKKLNDPNSDSSSKRCRTCNCPWRWLQPTCWAANRSKKTQTILENSILMLEANMFCVSRVHEENNQYAQVCQYQKEGDYNVFWFVV